MLESNYMERERKKKGIKANSLRGSSLMKFAQDTKLSGEVDSGEVRATLKENLNRLEENTPTRA